MRIYLFNDTSPERPAGCHAVMESLGKALAGHDIIARNLVGQRFYNEQALRDCDALLVNGEGTLHHGAGAWLMEMILNPHFTSPPNRLGHGNVLPRIAGLAPGLRKTKSPSKR
jgi:hypothetical protein